MTAFPAFAAIPNVIDIPYVTEDEAYALLQTELDRFLRLVETLGPDDWSKPTACSAWDVRDMLAHQAGGYASGTGYKEVFRQSRNIRPGRLPEDAINEFQLQERAGRTPTELIAELRQVGPLAAENWAYRFRLAKLVAIPHDVTGKLSLRHLMLVVHSRDTWMHRLDISRATGREVEQTPEHDGRIAALVMRDVAESLGQKLPDAPAITFDLTGIAGGVWQIGRGEPVAAIRMDVLDFNIFASGRYTYEQARPLATITGDQGVAERALQHTVVLY